MTRKFTATLVDTDGNRRDFITTDLLHDVMFPKYGGKLLYLSRISSLEVLEANAIPGYWEGIATMAFTGRPLEGGLATLVYEKTTCLSEIQFYGDDNVYLLVADERICEKVQKILQHIRFYGSYKENLPGTFGRLFNIGSYYTNFLTATITLLFLGLLFLLGVLILVLISHFSYG